MKSPFVLRKPGLECAAVESNRCHDLARSPYVGGRCLPAYPHDQLKVRVAMVDDVKRDRWWLVSRRAGKTSCAIERERELGFRWDALAGGNGSSYEMRELNYHHVVRTPAKVPCICV